MLQDKKIKSSAKLQLNKKIKKMRKTSNTCLTKNIIKDCI